MLSVFFELENYFYLITKNRNKDFDGRALVYKIANQTGVQQAILIGEINTGKDFENGAITSATISEDRQKVVLLTHSKIILYQNFGDKPFIEVDCSEILLNHTSQKESICLIDNKTLLISDEKDDKIGGLVCRLKL